MRVHLGDILTVSHGFMVAPNGLDSVQNLLEFMISDSMITLTSLPMIAEFVRPSLYSQLPFLSDIESPDYLDAMPKANKAAAAYAWRDDLIAKYGEYHEVAKAQVSVQTRK